MVGPDAIGVLKGAPAPELARLFVEYVLTPDGQRLLFQPKGVNGQMAAVYRMPVRSALYGEAHAPAVNPYQYHSGFQYDEALGNRRWSVVNDLIGVWLIDAHTDLAQAWKSVIAAGCPSNAVQQLCAPPLAGAQVEALAKPWKDARQRMETMRQWAADAEKRYRGLRGG
jgi:hypothetical protein